MCFPGLLFIPEYSRLHVIGATNHLNSSVQISTIQGSFFDREYESVRDIRVFQQRRHIKAGEIQPSPHGPSFKTSVIESNPMLSTDLLLPGTSGSGVSNRRLG